MENRKEIITGNYWINFQYDFPDGIWKVVAWKQVEHGILQLIYHYASDNVEQVKADVSRSGTFSARPFTVGRLCDGTTDECCHALYWDFCTENGLDPVALHRQAYLPLRGQSYRELDYDWIRRVAHWQGIVYPPRWKTDELLGLLTSLYAINNRSLVAILVTSPTCRAMGSDHFIA